MRPALVPLVALSGMGAPLAAQELDAGDFARLAEIGLERCLQPMLAGEEADIGGLGPVEDVESTVFLDDAVTADNRIVLQRGSIRGLRFCEVGNNERRVEFDRDKRLTEMTAALDGIAGQLAEAMSVTEDTGCSVSNVVVSARFLEDGDYRREFRGEAETRKGVFLTVSLTAARESGDGGMMVAEHYGAPEPQCP